MSFRRRAFRFLAILALSGSLLAPARAQNLSIPFTTWKALKYAPLPRYPETLQRRERFGSHTQDREPSMLHTAIFLLTFDADGKVAHIKVLQRTGIGPYEDACLEALSKWRAYPGKLKQLVVPISFVVYSFRPPPPRAGLARLTPDNASGGRG